MSKDYIQNEVSQFCDSISRVGEASIHCKDTVPENSKQISPEMKLRGIVPNSYIHVSVKDLGIHKSDLLCSALYKCCCLKQEAKS
jgi:hypothetical protein